MSKNNEKHNVTENTDAPHINKAFAIAAISIFMALIALPMILWGILGIIPEGRSFFEIELSENRNPAKFPERFDPKTFTAELETYINDNIPFRSLMISAQSELTSALEKPYRSELRPQLIEWLYTDNTQNTQNNGGSNTLDSSGGSPFPPPSDFNNDLIMGGGAGTTDDNNGSNGDQSQNQDTNQDQSGGENNNTPSACSHSFRETIIKNSTCLLSGEKKKECVHCGYYTLSTIPNGHVGTVIKTVAPSLEDYGYTLNKCIHCQGEYRTDITNKLYDTSPFPLTIFGPQNAGAVEGRSNWLFYSGNNSIKYYQGTNKLDNSKLAEYTAVFQELNDLCREQNKQLVIMIMPNKEQIYPEYMPTLDVESGKKRTQLFVDYVAANSDVNIIYPYEELMSAKPYWQVYSRLDTHWNAAGGFMGVQALYKALGMETTPMYYLPIVESLDHTLSGSDLIGIGNLNKDDYGNDTDYDIIYKPDISVNVTGGMNTNDITVTTSNSPNQCNFVMLSDSFRKNMVRFLIKDFSNTLCTHRNNIGNAEVQKAIKDSDILVIASVERIDTDAVNAARRVIDILKRQK